ncbi:MAG: glycerate kinase [Firmicutes bacterium]|nr:glycerate kinase [Bacillota bacterium]
MRVLVAPCSFKGSLSALEAAEAMAEGWLGARPRDEVIRLPVADGGEGTLEVLLHGSGGRLLRSRVSGPLGEPVEAEWGLLPDGTAVVELAQAAGLGRLPPGRRDPLRAGTRGVGELVRAALDAGARRLLVTLGGSATNDGGAGLLRALGAELLDAAGRPLEEGGAALARLERLDLTRLEPRLAGVELAVACDVTNPLLGPSGASAVYGPQKGAGPAEVARLERALERWAERVEAAVAPPPSGRWRDAPGAGAAGGAGFALLAVLGARFEPGARLVLDRLGFDERLAGSELVLTGEGRLDGQTAFGKAPAEVARRAARRGVPAVALAGGLGPGAEGLLEPEGGLAALLPAVDGPVPLEEAMAEAAVLVRAAAERAARLVGVGLRLAASGGGGAPR